MVTRIVDHARGPDGRKPRASLLGLVEDRSGPVYRDWLEERGEEVREDPDAEQDYVRLWWQIRLSHHPKESLLNLAEEVHKPWIRSSRSRTARMRSASITLISGARTAPPVRTQTVILWVPLGTGRYKSLLRSDCSRPRHSAVTVVIELPPSQARVFRHASPWCRLACLP